jgi:tripartite-type tricarboxylate transporter receptor subunit TctC
MKRILVLLAFIGSAFAQPITLYPISPITSTVDKAARFMADKLAADIGRPVVVKNLMGADGLIALRAAVADPGGVFLGNANLSSFLNDPEKAALVRQLTPVQPLYYNDTVLAVPASSSVKTVADLQRLSAERSLLIPVSGIFGSAQARDFDAAVGVRSTPVPYTDKGQMQIDLVNGLLDYTINGVSNAQFMAMVQAGKLRVLASVMANRTDKFPEAPTLKELGFRSVNTFDWNAVFTVEGMPTEDRDKVYASVKRIFASPEAAEFSKSINSKPLAGLPDTITKRMQAEALLFTK